MAHSIRSAAVTIHLIVKATPHSNYGAPAMIQQLNAALNKIKKEG